MGIELTDVQAIGMETERLGNAMLDAMAAVPNNPLMPDPVPTGKQVATAVGAAIATTRVAMTVEQGQRFAALTETFGGLLDAQAEKIKALGDELGELRREVLG